jgi:hypothetical protein
LGQTEKGLQATKSPHSVQSIGAALIDSFFSESCPALAGTNFEEGGHERLFSFIPS